MEVIIKTGIINGAYLNPDGTKDYAKFKRHGYDFLDAGEMVNTKGKYYAMYPPQLLEYYEIGLAKLAKALTEI